jgi:hypothetical protein
MAKKNPNERFSIDNQLIAHLRDMRSAQRDHQLACLELAQEDNPHRQHVVTTLEAEIKHHELNIERLNAAKLAQQNQDVEVDEQAKTQRIAELSVQRDAAVIRAKQVPIELIDYLAGAGPLWTASVNAVSEVNSLTRELVRLTGGNDALKRVLGHGDNGHGALAAAVGSALAATGMGTQGPSLAPTVSISPPLRAFTATDLEHNLTNLFNNQADAIERAGKPAPTNFED